MNAEPPLLRKSRSARVGYLGARDSDDPQFGRLDMRPFVADGGQVRARAWFTALQWIRAPLSGPGIGQGGPPMSTPLVKVKYVALLACLAWALSLVVAAPAPAKDDHKGPDAPPAAQHEQDKAAKDADKA